MNIMQNNHSSLHRSHSPNFPQINSLLPHKLTSHIYVYFVLWPTELYQLDKSRSIPETMHLDTHWSLVRSTVDTHVKILTWPHRIYQYPVFPFLFQGWFRQDQSHLGTLSGTAAEEWLWSNRLKVKYDEVWDRVLQEMSTWTAMACESGGRGGSELQWKN